MELIDNDAPALTPEQERAALARLRAAETVERVESYLAEPRDPAVIERAGAWQREWWRRQEITEQEAARDAERAPEPPQARQTAPQAPAVEYVPVSEYMQFLEMLPDAIKGALRVERAAWSARCDALEMRISELEGKGCE